MPDLMDPAIRRPCTFGGNDDAMSDTAFEKTIFETTPSLAAFTRLDKGRSHSAVHLGKQRDPLQERVHDNRGLRECSDQSEPGMEAGLIRDDHISVVWFEVLMTSDHQILADYCKQTLDECALQSRYLELVNVGNQNRKGEGHEDKQVSDDAH